MGNIICGFPGIGKSYIFNNKLLNCSDSDSSKFDKQFFPMNYTEHIRKIKNDFDYIFVSTHKDVIKSLIDNGFKFTIVYPDITLKDEYLERFKNRKSPETFIKLLDKMWDQFINDIESIDNDNIIKIKLESKQYLQDVIK
jgi:hypothetical protein